MICWRCKSDIGEFDNYCKYCGAGQGAHLPFYYKNFGIIILFLCIGPFALWFVWKSPALTKTTRWVYTIIMLGLTYFASYKFYQTIVHIKEIYDTFLFMPF